MNAKETTEVSHDEIALLAHLKWQSEGKPEGRSLQHWLDAERLLKTAKAALVSERNGTKSKTESSKPASKRKPPASKKTAHASLS